jgi:hypothetical protein
VPRITRETIFQFILSALLVFPGIAHAGQADPEDYLAPYVKVVGTSPDVRLSQQSGARQRFS